MPGSLNIKNDQAVSAVRRLATHYGTSYTQAIVLAAQEVLTEPDDDRMRREIGKVEASLDAYRVLATNLGGTDEGMYDKQGLPRW